MKDEIRFSKEEMDTMVDALLGGATMSDVANIGRENLEAGYALAYSLYNSGNYKDADTMFRSLCLYDHTDQRFWTGLAGCRQANGDLAGAIDAYALAAYNSGLGDPAPVVHGGLCHLKLGDKENAVNLFKAALDMGDKGNAEDAAFQERARSLLAMLEKGE